MSAPRKEAGPPPAFAEWVEENLGFHPENPTASAWDQVLTARLGATKSPTFDDYQAQLGSPNSKSEELAQLARVMTIGETYFFRDSRQFEAMMTQILPELLMSRPGQDNVRILSAACSTGEEPYSLAIAAQELLGAAASRVEIVAFDVNPEAVAAAKRGSYSEWSLRATPSTLRRKYFKKSGSHNLLSEDIKQRVTFSRRNFFEDDATFWQPDYFDVIWCRNVLIYFSPRKVTTVLKRLSTSLARDGALFLGNAETPRGYFEELVPREICGTFCYQKGPAKVRPQSPAEDIRPLSARGEPETSENTQVRAEGQVTLSAPSPDAWMVAIDAATRRLSTLLSAPTNAQPKVAASPVPTDEARQSEARALIEQERFPEALSLLDTLVSQGLREPKIDLLRASILTNQGKFLEARDICTRLLVDSPHSAGAYHLLGVAAEQEGRLDEACRHHEMAVLLDPKFGMSYWLLGRLCLRAARREQARRHLNEALKLFLDGSGNEGSAEMFSGGFGREALLRLCRADLARCEVRA